MKATLTVMNKLEYTNVMKYQGIILNLSSFKGTVFVKSNSFNSLQFKYSHCNIEATAPTAVTTSLWNTLEAYQNKGLFFIKAYENVQIISNTFTSCNSYSGLIFLKKYTDTVGILIHSNTFTKNSGYLTTNAIRIDIQTSLGYDTAITTTMPCAGVQISSNTFSQNIGCKNTGGVLQAS